MSRATECPNCGAWKRPTYDLCLECGTDQQTLSGNGWSRPTAAALSDLQLGARIAEATDGWRLGAVARQRRCDLRAGGQATGLA